ncbi:dihydrolipoamide acetyltransferase family protein [Tepidanaerobacter syntrophicus]|uniref:dihydrolipoamide acetyltransferase family protein n=1 Tax=Tepidanaerobacter syntrophicus TaxID=224999 RepID=UPI001BD4AB6D
MAVKVIMPKQGLQMTEGTITHWLVKEGDFVKEGQPLFEMETDKLTITIDAKQSGTLLKIIHNEGDVVPVGETIAIIGEPGEDYTQLLKDAEAKNAEIEEKINKQDTFLSASKNSINPEKKETLSTPRARMRAREKNIDYKDIPGSGPQGMVTERDVLNYISTHIEKIPKATPLAKKLAATEGIDLKTISPNEINKRIKGKDVESVIEQSKISEKRSEKIIPISSMRKVIADRMVESLQSMAQANHRMNVDMTKAVEVREQFKSAGIKISYNDIIIRCVAKALREFPIMNASFTDEGIIQKEYINIGMAVALEEGLIVPVIRDADLMTLQQIAEVSAQLAEKARRGNILPEEYTGGTFTVTNLGMLDVDSFTAIINPPEIGILAVGKISKQAVVQEDDTILPRPIMQLSLTYDHRAVDGEPAARFLKYIKTLLENPGLLL